MNIYIYGHPIVSLSSAVGSITIWNLIFACSGYKNICRPAQRRPYEIGVFTFGSLNFQNMNYCRSKSLFWSKTTKTSYQRAFL